MSNPSTTRLARCLVPACLLSAIAGVAWAAEPASPLLGVYGGPSSGIVKTGHESGVQIFYPSVHWTGTHNAALKSFVDLCHQSGIKVYPSLATAIDSEDSEFVKTNPQFWEKDIRGNNAGYDAKAGLSYAYPEVRAYKIQAIMKLVEETGVDGVMLDYTRFFGNQAGYCERIVKEFRQATGKDAFKLDPTDPQWVKFRANYVTTFVRELREAMQAHRSDLRLIGCVGHDPVGSLNDVLQDWGAWVDEGLVDGIVSMIYERSTATTLDKINTAQAFIDNRVEFIPLIACWGDNLDTPALLTAGTVKAFQAGVDGVGFYRSDAIHNLNLWETIGELSRLDLAEIQSQPVNFLENGGFESGTEHWASGLGEGIRLTDDTPSSGSKALRLNVFDEPTIRQLIDRGWFGNGKSIRVAGQVRLKGGASGHRLTITVSSIGHDGKEVASHLPLTLDETNEWQPVEAFFPLDQVDNLKLIILSLSASGPGGNMDLDDFTVTFSSEEADLSGHVVVNPELVRTSPKDRNIVRGQLAQASSFWENGYEPWRAIDGTVSPDNEEDKGYSWYSQRPALNQSLTIYLPERQQISRFRLLNSARMPAYRTKQFRIEVSNDDRTYRTVSTGTLPNDGTTWTELRISPVQARFIRFVGVDGYNTDYAVGLQEFEVYP